MMRKRFAVFGVLAFALVLLFPFNAFAVDFMPKGVFYQTELDGGNFGAVVAAYNQYDAACYVLGKNPDSISAAIKTKLSDPDYGGRFYDYAQSFFTQSGTLEDVPGWVPTYVVWGSELADLVLTDYQSVWYSTSTKSLHDDALTDLLRVLAGEDLGGGGSDGLVFDGTLPSSIVLNTLVGSAQSSFNWVDSGYISPSGSFTISFNNVATSQSTLSSLGITHVYGVYVPYDNRGNNSAGAKDYLYLFYSTDVVDFSFDTSSGSIRALSINLSCPNGTIYYSRFEPKTNHTPNRYPPTISGSKSCTISNPNSVGHSFSIPSSFTISGHVYYVVQCATNGPGAVIPPSGDWPEPDTPVTPEPPEQPTPTAPTVTPDTDPTEPVVTWPTSPTVVLPTQPTPDTTPSGLDYTGLLTLINDNLISIDDYVQALNSSFNSFRTDFLTAVDSIVDSIRNIYNYLGHLNDILEVHCKHIRDQIEDSVYNLELYIKDLFEWLPRQLDYDAEFNYDDTYVTNLLHRILNKIPGGSAGTPVTYQPNPQADEPGFFDWLLDLWHRFLIDLVSVLPDELGGLVDAFSQLTHYFPFSIPWDLAALLALFEHEPVTPVFDVPWGFGGDEGEIQMVRVDLHAWDGVMEMVRPVFVAGFCIQLALITKELLENFDIHRGGV